MASSQKCAVCGTSASNCCSSCKKVFYCGRDHQKKHWKSHKSQCVSYKIDSHESCGRFLVAARDIRAGELILQEQPCVLGPKMITAESLCLACFRKVDGTYKCSRCRLPVCSMTCQNAAQHADFECGVFSKISNKIQDSGDPGKTYSYIYQCVTPLRCLLLQSKNPKQWEALTKLVSHCDKRQGTEIYRVTQNNVVDFMRNFLQVEDFDDKLIHEVCGILDTNSFEIRYPELEKIRGLYGTASLLNHDCKPNTRHVFDENLNIKIYATVNIKQGTPITATYTQTLWHTFARRSHLRMAKHFDCVCQRCKDPEELGTFLGALKCTRCADFVLSQDPLNEDAPWKCRGCGHALSGKQVRRGHEDLRKELKVLAAKTRDKAGFLENYIKKYSQILHERSSHIIEAKYALTQLYGNGQGLKLGELTDEQMSRKVDLCHELLDLADVLEPGLTRFRGQLLLELQSAMVCQAQLQFHNDLITQEQAKQVLEQAMTYLKEAADILNHEADLRGVLQDRMAEVMTLLAE